MSSDLVDIIKSTQDWVAWERQLQTFSKVGQDLEAVPGTYRNRRMEDIQDAADEKQATARQGTRGTSPIYQGSGGKTRLRTRVHGRMRAARQGMANANPFTPMVNRGAMDESQRAFRAEHRSLGAGSGAPAIGGPPRSIESGALGPDQRQARIDAAQRRSAERNTRTAAEAPGEAAAVNERAGIGRPSAPAADNPVVAARQKAAAAGGGGAPIGGAPGRAAISDRLTMGAGMNKPDAEALRNIGRPAAPLNEGMPRPTAEALRGIGRPQLDVPAPRPVRHVNPGPSPSIFNGPGGGGGGPASAPRPSAAPAPSAAAGPGPSAAPSYTRGQAVRHWASNPTKAMKIGGGVAGAGAGLLGVGMLARGASKRAAAQAAAARRKKLMIGAGVGGAGLLGASALASRD